VPGLLDGVRVLDLSIWRPGPYCTQLLAELGADVVKVEPPGGDPMRVFPALFADLNAGKRAAVVDLKEEAGRDAVVELARGARVAVEGFRPGVAARLGVGPDDLLAVNPRLVYCSISGYGQAGPLAQVPGHDVNYQSWAGVLDPPHLPKPPLADLAGGAYAALAVCAALARGEGEVIDVSMTEVLASWTGTVGPLSMPDGTPLGGRVAGYGLYATADGWVSLGVLSEDHLWAALATAAGLDDVAGLDFGERTLAVDDLEARLAAALAGRRRDELVDELAARGVPIAPVLDQAGMLAARGLALDGPPMAHPLRYRHHPAGRTVEVPPLSDVLPDWA
jgi:crotonobetainyl-CoA:carnitine CoA-transferase CaiB-like acyl-CoA transferase